MPPLLYSNRSRVRSRSPGRRYAGRGREEEEEEEEMGDSGDAILAHLQTGDTTREDQSHLETGEGGGPTPLATGGGHLETDVGPGIIVPVPREIGEVLPPIDVRDGGGGTVPLIILLMSEGSSSYDSDSDLSPVRKGSEKDKRGSEKDRGSKKGRKGSEKERKSSSSHRHKKK